MVYNSTMRYEPDAEPTAKDVVKFVVKNFEHIDMERLADEMAQASWITRPLELKASVFVSDQIKGNPAFAMARIERRVFACKNAPKIVEEMIAGQKVPAIKLIRQGYGLGLKEAKDIADHLQDELFIRNRVSSAYNCNATLGKDQQAAINEIMEHIDG